MKVAVLGAGGTIAPAIVRDLAESDQVSSTLLLDINTARAEVVASEHGGSKAHVVEVDARSNLSRALEGCDFLINSASYRINLDAMRASIEAGCNYIDLGGLYWLTSEQLKLNDEFEQAGLLAILGMGSSPGKTNVMAKRAVKELGFSAERVDIIAGGRDMDPPDGFSVPYALQTLIDELTMKPIVVRDGDAIEIEPLTKGGSYTFPEPIGESETIFTLHSELLTFPTSFDCRQSSFRLSLRPELLKRLKELTGASEQEIEALASKAVPPSSKTLSIHIVEAEGDGKVVRVTAVIKPHEEWGMGGGIVSTGTPATAAVRLFDQGKIKAKGVLPPELCIEPDDLFPELESRGCKFTVETLEAVES